MTLSRRERGEDYLGHGQQFLSGERALSRRAANWFENGGGSKGSQFEASGLRVEARYSTRFWYVSRKGRGVKD